MDKIFLVQADSVPWSHGDGYIYRTAPQFFHVSSFCEIFDPPISPVMAPTCRLPRRARLEFTTSPTASLHFLPGVGVQAHALRQLCALLRKALSLANGAQKIAGKICLRWSGSQDLKISSRILVLRW